MFEKAVEKLIAKNREAFIKEATLAFDMMRQNRHSSVEPYEWLGPSMPPRAAGETCACPGCQARFSEAEWKF